VHTLRKCSKLLGTLKSTIASAAMATATHAARPSKSQRPRKEVVAGGEGHGLIPPIPRPCSLASSVTVATFYAAIVFYSLRKALRDSGARKFWILFASQPAGTASFISRSL